MIVTFIYSLYISGCSIFIRLIGHVMVVVFQKHDNWWIGSIDMQRYSGVLILRYDCQNMKYGTSNLQLEKILTSNNENYEISERESLLNIVCDWEVL